MSSPQKAERLLNLMNLLLGSPTPIAASELRKRMSGYPADDNSFKRAFERDKDELREMGVPLTLETIGNSDPPLVGYRIRLADYALRDPGLEPDELEALNMAAAAVGAEGGLGSRALYKLGAAPPAEPRTEIPTDSSMVAAFTGVAERRTLRFRYRGEDREVDPYRLEFLRGRWYLNGFDHLRQDNRWFRLGRVEGRIVVGDRAGAFERPSEPIPELRLDPFAFGGGAPPVQAEVWFDPGVRTAVLAGLDDPHIVADDDKGLVLRLEVTNREGFRSWVASFLDRAEVKAPADLRAEFVAWLQSVAAGGPAPEPAGERA